MQAPNPSAPNLLPLPPNPTEALTPGERAVFDEVIDDSANHLDALAVDYANRRSGRPETERKAKYLAANSLLRRDIYGAEDRHTAAGAQRISPETVERLQSFLDIPPQNIAPIPQTELPDLSYKPGSEVTDPEMRQAMVSIQEQMGEIENTARLLANQPPEVAKLFKEDLQKKIASLDGTLKANPDLGIIAQKHLSDMHVHADAMRAKQQSAEAGVQGPRAELAAMQARLQDLTLNEPPRTDAKEPVAPVRERIDESDPAAGLRAKKLRKKYDPTDIDGPTSDDQGYSRRFGRASDQYTARNRAYLKDARVQWEQEVADLRNEIGAAEARLLAAGPTKSLERAGGEAGLRSDTIRAEQSTNAVALVEGAIQAGDLTVDYSLSESERQQLRTDIDDHVAVLATKHEQQTNDNTLDKEFHSAQSMADLENLIYDLNTRITAAEQSNPKGAQRDPRRAELIELRDEARTSLLEAHYEHAHLRLNRMAREGSDGRTPIVPLLANENLPYGAIYYPAYDTAITPDGIVFTPTPEEHKGSRTLPAGLGQSALYGNGITTYETPATAAEAAAIRNANIASHSAAILEAQQQEMDAIAAGNRTRNPITPVDIQQALIGAAALRNLANVHSLNAHYYDSVAADLRAREAAAAAAAPTP